MINWEKAKQEYITTGISLEKLSKKYGVHPSTAQRHSRLEGWVSEKKKYDGIVTEKCLQKTAEKYSERFAEYAVKMELDLVEVHKSLFRKIAETMNFGDAFSPRDLKCLSSMLVDLISNYLRMKETDQTVTDNVLRIEWVNGEWDKVSDPEEE